MSRFHLGEYTITANLRECFFQVGIPEEQRDFFRLLWFENDDVKNGQIEMWHFIVHVWAIVSIPFTTTRAIHQVAKANRTNMPKMTTTAVRQNMYVNDLLKSLDLKRKAYKIYHEMKALFADSGFSLTKWSANSQDILEELPEPDRAPQAHDLGIN